MEPSLAKNDKIMFYKYLNSAKVYFEYGSGGSTYQAAMKNNISKIYSVESDKGWYDKLKNILIKNTNLQYFYIEMDTQPRTWGSPGPKSTKQQHINYSEQIKLISKDEQKNIDLVFIDGRFRVACCLKCFDVINDDCLIIFDDFLNRKHYHVVLKYYDIVEKTIDERMVVLKKKKNISSIPKELIKKYELIRG
jgi:protein O-GlcNAc transferase